MELRGGGPALLDEPLALEVRGAPPGADLLWRARLRDDDDLVWKATAPTAAALLDASWRGRTAAAALASLRPVLLEVRCEAPSGAVAARDLRRLLLGEGALVRRWRDLRATLHRPAGDPCATVLAPAEPGAGPAAALLASRGALVLLVAGDRAPAVERLGAVPGAGAPVVVDALPLPPGVPARDPADRAARWDELLARLGARPRGG